MKNPFSSFISTSIINGWAGTNGKKKSGASTRASFFVSFILFVVYFSLIGGLSYKTNKKIAPLKTLVSPIHHLIALLCASGLLTALCHSIYADCVSVSVKLVLPFHHPPIFHQVPSLPPRILMGWEIPFNFSKAKGVRLLSLSFSCA